VAVAERKKNHFYEPEKEKEMDMNFFTAINSALSIAMSTDDTAILFGEDVAFGGVFRCSSNLLQTFGPHRVFNTPLSETGIAGFAIGYAASGGTSIAVSAILFDLYGLKKRRLITSDHDLF
jgi:pyruvate/2-oxoglutarate/acetoin dehydrogenase E1 component